MIENVLRPRIEKKNNTPPPVTNACKKMGDLHRITPVNYYEETHATQITPTTTKVKKLFFIPNQKDSLFWCFYYIKYNILPTTINALTAISELDIAPELIVWNGFEIDHRKNRSALTSLPNIFKSFKKIK